MLSQRRINRIISESIRKVLFEDETALNTTSDGNVSSAMSNTKATTDSNGTSSYSTGVSNVSGNKDKGDDMVITGRSNNEVQQKLQQNKAQNPSFYNNPANRVHFKVNPTGNFKF